MWLHLRANAKRKHAVFAYPTRHPKQTVVLHVHYRNNMITVCNRKSMMRVSNVHSPACVLRLFSYMLHCTLWVQCFHNTTINRALVLLYADTTCIYCACLFMSDSSVLPMRAKYDSPICIQCLYNIRTMCLTTVPLCANYSSHMPCGCTHANSTTATRRVLFDTHLEA
jgi:hypothetical protein